MSCKLPLLQPLLCKLPPPLQLTDGPRFDAVTLWQVTQFCFDAAAATGFVDALRADGLGVDVSLGVISPDVTMARRVRVPRLI